MMKREVFVVIIATVSTMVWLGCESETIEEPADCDENPVMLELVSATAADCAMSNGSIEVAASGGNGDYSFSIGNGMKQTTSVFDGLGAGEYEIIVADGKKCADTLRVMVESASGLDMTVQVDVAGCKTSSGAVTVNGVNGTTPYQYKFGEGTFGSTNTFTGLQAGEYDLVVKDAAGCEVTKQARITSGVSYSTSIKEIIETKCAISGCHNGTQQPDFRAFKNIQDNAAQVKTLTANGSMPVNATLTQEQINLIACWVDDGAQSN
jgi:hypothetical protein